MEGTAVDKGSLQPGDLLFFASNEGHGPIHHVGMYTGDGMMIHSPGSSSSVQMESIYSNNYSREYWGARRYNHD